MKILFNLIILVLFSSFISSNSQWNMVYESTDIQYGIGSQFDLDCSDSMNCISVASRGDTRLLKTTDGGNSWSIVFEDLQQEVYNELGQIIEVLPTKYKAARSVDYVTHDLVVVGHQKGQITISRNGGFTFDSISLSTQDINIIRFTDSLTGIALTNNYIFLTTDSGITWDNISSNLNYSGSIYFQSAFIKDDFIYAGGFVSTDKGKSWSKSNTVNNIGGMYGVYFINNYEGWCIGRKQISNQFYSHVILHTTDGGHNFETQLDTTISDGGFGLIGGIFFINEYEGLAWGGSIAWLTSDGGKSWVRDPNTNMIVNNRFNKMAFPNNNFTKRIANTEMAGTIWLYEDLTLVHENELSVVSINIFPNPASDFITIQFQPSEGFEPSEGSKVQIFDVLGIEVAQTPSSVSGSQTGASDLLRIDVSKLPTGVYFIRINCSNGACSIVEKFIKI